jgi:hypothetical protein
VLVCATVLVLVLTTPVVGRGGRTASSSLRGGALQQQTHAGADVYMYSVKHAKRQQVSRYIDSSENHHRLAHVDGCRDNVASIIAS